MSRLQAQFRGWGGLLALGALLVSGAPTPAQTQPPRVRQGGRRPRVSLPRTGLPDLSKYAAIELDLPEERLAQKGVLKIQSQDGDGKFKGTLVRTGGGETAVTGEILKSDTGGFTLRFTNALSEDQAKSFEGAAYETDGRLILGGTYTLLEKSNPTAGPFPFTGGATASGPVVGVTLNPATKYTDVGTDRVSLKQDRALLSTLVPKDIIAAAEARSDLSTFLKLVRSGGWEAFFRGRTMTVFAPTDAAFARLRADQFNLLVRPEPQYKDYLKRFLFTCIIPGHRYFWDPRGKKNAEELPRGNVATQWGDPIDIEDPTGGSGLTLSLYNRRAIVTQRDINAGNAVLHVTNNVLLPPPPGRFD